MGTTKRYRKLNNQHISGFSLVELSLTLMIIGMIIGGITGGAHLLKIARLNKVISEISGYAESIDNFRQKYRAWPGDMPNAQGFWGFYADPANTEGTVNGDGDELITGNATERMRSWQQLALSGMIAGHYTGVDAGTPDHQAGVNLPAGVIKTSHYYMGSLGSTYYDAAIGSTWLQLGKSASSGANPHDSVISPADAYVIDKKTDDGKADGSNIFALRGNNNANTVGKCVTNKWDQATSDYILTDYDDSCRIFYWLDKL